MAVNQIPVTVIGAELLKEELSRLRSVDRPNIIQAIAEARAQGDLSENAEYESAKERQSFIEGRIAELESKLSNLQVIDPKTLNAEGRVVFGATVRFEDLDSGDTKSYQIVGEDEANIKGGKISVGSPIARALIGKSEGEIAEVLSPGGVKEFEIIEVLYI
ncbi:MAG: transcription elongation factor GreA [Methylophilaceae bacterium 17-44-8]|jgi:transcription elongation factor GreA|nr:MAG: transcription elongation factor GreA [Methylophilales bacterium 28-44-11]OZA05653.1 MAG: transcription elongation factor GreA [Methylophilaceae bacterium 17-44-8]